MKVSNELKVAITILIAIFIGFVGYRLMSDLPLFRQSNTVQTYFSRADGLSAGNYVYVNGVKVGSVKKIKLLSNDSVGVTMSFDLDVDIPKNSVAYLESTGLLDGKAIVVERGDAKENLHYGDTIEGEYRAGVMETFGKKGDELSKDVSDSFGKLNKLLARLNSMMDEESKKNVKGILRDLETTSKEVSTLFKNKRRNLENSINHAERFLANVDTVSMRNKSRIDSVMTGLDRSLTQLETLAQNLKSTNSKLDQILTKINDGEGSLGKLVNDPGLYNNLESLTGEMDTLINNINNNPQKYLKGMKLIEVF
ncbi:phospholipid/cholesterol/gamma-HCH transport system substrate-binding protein [Fodinibius salinus]|uniref:Phospholipid/cholesterol/gamma-HCH transport system substrate-binding protein n=1 Tax=Fodinibius salinus TaxID=860790 RepID=A0A5D3YKI5_9BACT|nr:MlaD family protein [Fodinibius salinus]TYP93940.1 phospholipid/cholesterol/gamma-HCH transport system substrate-binding protein [Fodinibius salinus]